MRQILCDVCKEPIDPGELTGDDMYTQIEIYLMANDCEPAISREFHRKCARTLTVADVWQRSGQVPL